MVAWGIDALETRDGRRARAPKAVHICYGYGTPVVLKWKTRNTDWGHYGVTLPLLAKSSVDQVSVETAASGVDVAVLGELARQGRAGRRDRRREPTRSSRRRSSPERIRRVLPYVDAGRVCMPCTDCGLVPRSRAAALGKMRALARRGRRWCGPSCRARIDGA